MFRKKKRQSSVICCSSQLVVFSCSIFSQLGLMHFREFHHNFYSLFSFSSFFRLSVLSLLFLYDVDIATSILKDCRSVRVCTSYKNTLSSCPIVFFFSKIFILHYHFLIIIFVFVLNFEAGVNASETFV